LDLSHFLFEEKRLRRYLSRNLRGREDVEDYVHAGGLRTRPDGAERDRIHNAWGFLKRIAAGLIVDRVRREA
jgi:DNA-directed RNA polymerase specialized sigma24 family protein